MHGPDALMWIVLGLLGAGVAAYWAAVIRLHRRGKTWSAWRGVSFTLGVALLGAAFIPPLIGLAGGAFTGHMVQHLLIGMFAPLPLALAAPVTLVLATLPVGARRPLVRMLHSRPLRVVSHPVTAAILDMGGMFVLYLTPLYVLMLNSMPLHYLIMLHFFLAGYLFSWSIVGLDPAPGRPARSFRLAVLLLAAGAHAFLSKLMYANGWPGGTGHELEQIEAGAQLMYYGGDLAELSLAVVLFAGWYQARGRQYARESPSRVAVA